MPWSILIGVVCTVSIIAVYFIWIRKPASVPTQNQAQQPQG